MHEVLSNAGELSPYVLVGQSYGGLLVREYAAHYPNEVEGLVVIDGTHEDQMERMPPDPKWLVREVVEAARRRNKPERS